MSSDRLTMPIGEVLFTQRSVRKFRPDPIPPEDVRLVLEAAVKAPNGANRQIGRFLVVDDREKIREFARLYHEAWWAKRRDERGWTRPEDIRPRRRVTAPPWRSRTRSRTCRASSSPSRWGRAGPAR